MANRAVLVSRAELTWHGASMDADWEDVSQYHPCPVCGAGSNCRRHVLDAFVSCACRPSEWPLTNGGWLHRLTLLDDAPHADAPLDDSATDHRT